MFQNYQHIGKQQYNCSKKKNWFVRQNIYKCFYAFKRSRIYKCWSFVKEALQLSNKCKCTSPIDLLTELIQVLRQQWYILYKLIYGCLFTSEASVDDFFMEILYCSKMSWMSH